MKYVASIATLLMAYALLVKPRELYKFSVKMSLNSSSNEKIGVIWLRVMGVIWLVIFILSIVALVLGW